MAFATLRFIRHRPDSPAPALVPTARTVGIGASIAALRARSVAAHGAQMEISRANGRSWRRSIIGLSQPTNGSAKLLDTTLATTSRAHRPFAERMVVTAQSKGTIHGK
jgi:hypothetical protein